MKFGKLWLNSMHNNVDMTKVRAIFIVDTGLNEEDYKELSKYEKIKIIKSDLHLKDTSDVDKRNSIWLQHVLKKTEFLYKVVCANQDDLPIVMIDNDCMFLRDFSEMIDKEYDIQVCKRSYREEDNWIASFFVINNTEKGKKFLQLWREEMRDLMISRPERGWFESYALNTLLNKLAQEETKEIKVGNLETKIISCERPEQYDETETKIVHFKGNHDKSNISSRLKRFPFEDVLNKIKEYSG
jgi:hypothetical protein